MSSKPQKVYDLWASILNYKGAVGSLNRPGISINYIPKEHCRRLQAYEILSAYYNCYSRDFRMSPESGDTGDNDSVFEVGDPSFLCDKIKDKLLGDEVTINMPVPEILGSEESISQTLALEGLEPGQKTRLEEKLKNLKVISAIISERETYLQNWFKTNKIYLKIDENETLASYLGDCVYHVGWNAETGKPEIMTYDPGFCFPHFEIDELSWEDDTTPVTDRFIIAWEEIFQTDDPDHTTTLWRDVYELRVTAGAKKCYRQRSYYKYGVGSVLSLYDLTDDDAISETPPSWEDLGVDFIPILWVPNRMIQGEIFGQSNIAKLLPLYDAIMNSYTDLSANGEHLGGATVFISGSEIKLRKNSTTGVPVDIPLRPATMIPLGENGSANLLDTSTMQDALLKTIEKYEGKLIQISEITDIIAGKIDKANIPSGIALLILMQPLLDKIGKMRQQRQEKYTTLFDFVQRLLQTFGNSYEKQLFSGILYSVNLNFGAIIPSDDSAKMDLYNKMVPLLGLETVLVQMKKDGWNFDVKTVLQRVKESKQSDLSAMGDVFSYRRNQDNGGSGQ